MKNKKIINLIVIVIALLVTYFYDDIEGYIYKFNQKNISNIINTSIDNLEISYLDVGNADSILIRYKDNNVLIDAGNNEDEQKLVNYFKSIGVNKFNYVIGTHAHEDHIGGMDKIINNFSIEHFYMPGVITTTKTFEDVVDSLDKNNIKFETPKINDEFEIDELKFKIIYIGTDKEDLNNTSIVIKLYYKNTSYLFMGDATTTIESNILEEDIKSDVLKVGHHGSKYSSSAKFLKKVYPKYAIISVGKNNDYNHPSDIVINKLNKIGTTIYRTDKDGTIILKSDGEGITIDTKNTDTNGGKK